ncbi:hypothetical protein DSECCO2_611530 [anaerobic digester metagenome]
MLKAANHRRDCSSLGSRELGGAETSEGRLHDQEHEDGENGSDDPSDALSKNLLPRVCLEQVPALQVIHDVPGKAAGNCHDGCDAE